MATTLKDLIDRADIMIAGHQGNKDLPKVSEEDFIEYMQESQKALKMQEKLNDWILGYKGEEFKGLAWDSEELQAILQEFTLEGY